MLNNKATWIVINSDIEYIFIKSRDDRSDLMSYELSDPDSTSFALQMPAMPQTPNFPPFLYPGDLIMATMRTTIIIITVNIDYFPCTKHYTKHFTWIIWIKTHNNLFMWILLLAPEKWRDCPKVTELRIIRATIQTRAEHKICILRP